MAHVSGTFYSDSLKKHVPFTAIIPTTNESNNGNNRSNDLKTPPKRTLYLLHGWNGAHDSWLVLSRIYEVARDYNIAVIMPAGENSFYIDQYEGQMYGQFIGEELIAISREMFNLSSKKEDTWIAGLSMGGYGALRNGFKYSDTFGKIASFSSPILTARNVPKEETFNQDPIHIHLQNIVGSKYITDLDKDADLYELCHMKKNDQQIYLSCGTEDELIKDNRRYHDYLKKNQITHTYLETSGGHDWDFWNEQIIETVKIFTE